MTEAVGEQIEVRSDPHDRVAMREEVLAGLAREQKEISPKFFYDEVGSHLFEEITRLEEYYPTRTERALLKRWMPIWVDAAGPSALVELGAGSAVKTRLILDEMTRSDGARVYVPVDVSGDFIRKTAIALRAEYPRLTIEPIVADITTPIALPPELPAPAWLALLGSTLGNFDRCQANELLRRCAERLRPGDGFLLGVDLRPGTHKSAARLEDAYNDEDGLTAAFNLNVLQILNREIGSDFDPSAFEHRAFYSEEAGRIEMHLVSKRPQRVTFPGEAFVSFRAGESVRTEISCKYDRPTIEALFAEAGLAVERWVEDELGYFALILARGG
jgi:L-histidine Nalpha-methyltransferase